MIDQHVKDLGIVNVQQHPSNFASQVRIYCLKKWIFFAKNKSGKWETSCQKVKVEFLPEREETCARRAFASGPAEGRRQAYLLSKAPWKERRYNYILHGMEGLYLALNQHGWLRLCHSTIDWRSSKGNSTSSNWSSKACSDATSRSNHHLPRHHLLKYQCQTYVASVTI